MLSEGVSTIKIVTANIGRNIASAGVEADLRKIRATAPRGFIGFQEIDEADPANEHAILNRIFDKHTVANFDSRVPFLTPRRADVVKVEVIKLSPGVEHTSPPRVATEVWVKTRYSDKPLVFLNFHLIAGAWNKKIEHNQEVRRDFWWAAVDKLKDRVKYHHDAGRTVIWMGDVNRMDMPKLHKDERQIVTAGIDSISIVEGEVGVKVVSKGVIPLNSDHDAKYIKVRLKRKA